MTNQRSIAEFDALTCDPLDLLEQAGADLPERARWPERMAEIYEIEFRVGLRRGLDEEAAAADAELRTIALCDYIGGGALYVPRGDELRRAVRDRRIYRLAHRGNIEALAREHGLTPKAIYEIIAREKQRHLRKMQGRLFNENDPEG